MSESVKRTLSEVSDASSGSPNIETKRTKQLLSMSSSDDSLLGLITNMPNVITEESLQAMLSQMKNEIVTEVNENFNKHKEFLEERLLELENDNIQLKKDNSDLRKKVINLEERCSRIQKIALDAKNYAVENEQYSRKSNVKIFGVKEEKSEDTKSKVIKIFNEKLGVSLQEKDVDVAHRVGKLKPNKSEHSRSIIVKFIRREHKMDILKNRKKLRGSKTVVSDDMCQDLQKVYNRIKNDFRVKESWTWFGKIFVKDHSDKIYRVMYGRSLDEVMGSTQHTESLENRLRNIAEGNQLENK